MGRPSVQPVVWQPPNPPSRAKAKQGSRPLPPMRLIPVPGVGPEDIAIDAQGWLITGVADGRIWRISPDGLRIEQLADTGGRPLGVEVFADGRVLVCDAHRGLLRVDPEDGAVETLVSEVHGRALKFCNNAAIASDGTVYFTDSSLRFGIDHYRADLLEHSGTGRLLRRDPDGAVEVLDRGLQFANGVALAEDESFLVYAETGNYSISKLWLTGERAGQSEVLVANLPGFPDNISTGTDGLFWVALPAPRNPALDRLHRMHPVFRKLAWSLPERLQPQPGRTVWVLGVDGSGTLVHDLQGSGEQFHEVTGAREHGGRLWLGSLVGRAIAVLDLAVTP
jgi:sugar lactone lactonase YvrE